MKHSLFYAGVLLLLASCAQTGKPHYTVTYNAEEAGLDGKTAYIWDFDKDVNIDSAVIKNGVAVFDNEIDGSRYVSILIDGRSVGDFFLEGDSISITDGSPEGGKLNALHNQYWHDRMALIDEFRALPD